MNGLLLDVEDLEASVQAVEETGSRWGISESEVRSRRKFLESVKEEVRVRMVLEEVGYHIS